MRLMTDRGNGLKFTIECDQRDCDGRVLFDSDDAEEDALSGRCDRCEQRYVMEGGRVRPVTR
jgi:hypothetical protein